MARTAITPCTFMGLDVLEHSNGAGILDHGAR